MSFLSSILLLDDNAPGAFLLQRVLHRAQLTEQVIVASRAAEALALLAPPAGTPALQPCLILVSLHLGTAACFTAAYQRLATPLAKAPVIGTYSTPLPLSLLEQVQHLPLAGLLELPLTPPGLSWLQQLCRFPQAA